MTRRPDPLAGLADVTLPHLVDRLAADLPEDEAIVAPDGRVTWGELGRRIGVFAAALQGRGLRPGSRVGVLLPNGVRWVVATIGAQAAGATAVPINTWYGERELADALERAAVEVTVVDDAPIFGKDFAALVEELERAGRGNLHGVWRWPAADALPPAASTPGNPAPIAASGDDTAFILFTSGSTRRPKGVMLPHRSIVTTGAAIGSRQDFGPRDRMWLPTPLFFSKAAANAIPAALSHGATLCIEEQFDPNASLAFLERERCTIFYGIALHARQMVEHPEFESFDVSALRTGGGATTPEEKTLMIDRLGIEQLCSMYGMTETCGYSTLTEIGEPRVVRMSTQGRILPTQELRIGRDDGSVAEPGESGEIQIRGAIMSGYLDPEMNERAFTADGWFRTGDRGFLDEERRLHFGSRVAETIKYKGINVSPAEVEEAIRPLAGVREVFVFGRSDPVAGELVSCVIVPTDPALAAPDDGVAAGAAAALRTGIVAALREQVAKYMVPSELRFVTHDDVPLTRSSKVDRMELRLIAERAAGDPVDEDAESTRRPEPWNTPG